MKKATSLAGVHTHTHTHTGNDLIDNKKSLILLGFIKVLKNRDRK